MAPEAYFSALEVEEGSGKQRGGGPEALGSELRSLLDEIKIKGLDKGWSTKSVGLRNFDDSYM